MAIVFRNVSTSASSSSSTIIIAKPSGVVDGDLMVAFIEWPRANALPPDTCTPPAGWNEISYSSAVHGYWGSIYGSCMRCYYRVASSEGESYTFTLAGTANIQGGIVAYTGVSTSLPINVNSGNGRDLDESTNTWNAPSVTLPQAEWVICAYVVPGSRSVSAAPSDLTQRVKIDGDVLWIGDSNGNKPAGTYNPTAITISNNSTFGAFTLGLNPQPDTFQGVFQLFGNFYGQWAQI